MATSGNATGGNDVFNGKNRIFWSLTSQDMTDGGHGSSTVAWSWAVNWAPGDNCHTILNGHVVINAVDVYPITANVHQFDGSHVHTGDWPPFGGFGGGSTKIYHDASGNANITMTGAHQGTSGPISSASGTWALPQIPQTPASPSALTASRVSDTQASLAWTNNSTGTAPYAGVNVYRSTDGGGFALVASLGVVTSYTDTTITAGHKYTYRVSAVGSNGVEVGYATASAFWTTPSSPTSCTATKQGNGDVVVSWVNHVNYSEYTTRIEESTNGGSTWAEIASVASGITSWTHVAPSTGLTHTYRVRSRTSSGTTLNSAYSSNSNTVTLLATANPPTGLSPAGVARDATGAIVFTWTHNPADGTPQTKYQLQYKVDAGAYTTVGPTTSGASSYTLPANTVTNGHTITWHVATAGQNGTLSAYSADSTFATSAKPTAAFSAPGSSYNSSQLTASWTYFQAQGSAQASFVAQLYDAGANLLEQVTGTTATSATFSTALADGASYTVKVTVTSAAGLASSTASQAFTVTFLPPAAVHLAAAYDAGAGAMVLTITGDDPVAGVTVAIDHVDVQRQIDGGVWVTAIAGVVLTPVATVLTAIVSDPAPTIAGTNAYRLVAYSALPSSETSSTVTVVTAEKLWSFLSYGDRFATVARMRATPTFGSTAQRDRALYHFAGRALPVQLTGEAVDLALTVSGQLRDTSSTPEEFEAAAYTAGVVLWRDPTGRRVFGSIGQVQTQRSSKFAAQVSFTVTEVDYAE